MPALYLILNSAYYTNNYDGIFDTGLYTSRNSILQLSFWVAAAQLISTVFNLKKLTWCQA